MGQMRQKKHGLFVLRLCNNFQQFRFCRKLQSRALWLLRRFLRKSRVQGSSRALAWDTMLPTSSCGTRLSRAAVGHTGFTGTSLWVDPMRDVYVALLTNRVHPSRPADRADALARLRPEVHDAVVAALST